MMLQISGSALKQEKAPNESVAELIDIMPYIRESQKKARMDQSKEHIAKEEFSEMHPLWQIAEILIQCTLALDTMEGGKYTELADQVHAIVGKIFEEDIGE